MDIVFFSLPLSLSFSLSFFRCLPFSRVVFPPSTTRPSPFTSTSRAFRIPSTLRQWFLSMRVSRAKVVCVTLAMGVTVLALICLKLQYGRRMYIEDYRLF